MAEDTKAPEINEPAEAPPSRWTGAGLLRAHGSWLVFAIYGLITLGVIIAGLAYTEYTLELVACVVPPFVVGLLIPPVRRRIHLLALGAVCMVFVFAFGEALFRVRHFGTDALTHPRLYWPGETTTNSGLIRVSDDPAFGFELTPNFEGQQNGKRYSINSWGYRDREFTRERTPGVIRILVLGDSFAMASGVEAGNGLSRVLERLLNDSGIRAEVYNLAVSGYQLPQIEHVLETDGLALQPDLVILVEYTWVRTERWTIPEIDWAKLVGEEQSSRARQDVVRFYSFVRDLSPRWASIRSHLNRALARIGLGHAGAKKQKAPFALPIFLDHVTDAGRTHGFRTAVLTLRPLDFRPSVEVAMKADQDAIREWCEPRGVLFMDTYDAFPQNGLPYEYIIYPGNSHPNADSHARYAKSAAEQLEASGILDELARHAGAGSGTGQAH